ncbi:MAG: PspC domain-containing protein [Pedobacter sp.]|nr:MAG: PspC domain-containing protein [Pedobacter sp.]
MKKTIIINIGNSIIHIEEDAYEILTAYLNEIKQHFAKNADDFEIVTDIENRIAEMFAEILEAGKKQVIEITDVQNVIAQMGSVKDFIGEEEEETPKAQQHVNYEGAKKLYRDTDDGVIAGVCAGLGHYLNIEARCGLG